MCIIKRAASRWLQLAVGIFLVASICVFVGVGIMIQYQDLAETYKMAEETTAFVQAECKKFDNYTRGSSARALQDLLDKADGLKKFISPQQLADPAFLQEFIYTEHVGGVVILATPSSPLPRPTWTTRTPCPCGVRPQGKRTCRTFWPTRRRPMWTT